MLVSPGDRVAVPTLTLDGRRAGRDRDVKAEAAMIQAASGERANNIMMDGVSTMDTGSNGRCCR